MAQCPMIMLPNVVVDNAYGHALHGGSSFYLTPARSLPLKLWLAHAEVMAMLTELGQSSWGNEGQAHVELSTALPGALRNTVTLPFGLGIKVGYAGPKNAICHQPIWGDGKL